jgi:uncharacterized protein
VTAPTMVMMGKKDIQVDYELDGAPLEKAVEGRANIRFIYPENADHVVKLEPRPLESLTAADGLSYSASDRVLDPGALQTVED